MKLLSSLSILGLASQALAAGSLGFNLGVKTNSGQCKTTNDYLNDFNILKSYATTVKVYASSDCNTLQNIAPAVQEAGFKLFVGVWPNDDAHFNDEKNALSSYLPLLSTSNVQAVLVGSEALYRKDLTPQELADKINNIRDFIKNIKDKDGNSFSGVPVGTVDSWNILVDGYATPVIQASDIVLYNAFSYWQGQTMQNSSYSFLDDTMQALQTIQTAKGSTDITFWVGETGWPTDGTNFEASYPSTSNAQTFWQEGICSLRAWGINILAFEAFDEEWKPNTSGTSDVEKHWGVFGDDGKPKYNINCDF